MELQELRGEGFRNLSVFSLNPGSGINVIYGDNGAGKTSVLEAVYFLARAKSFRAPRSEKVIQRGAPRCWVFGRGERGSVAHRFGVQREPGRTRVRLNGEDVRSLSEWAAFWPVEVINSEAQRFVVDGPAVRRSFLNWGVFHVEHQYGYHWQRFRRALQQCNGALRSGDPRLAASWEGPVADAAEALDRGREAFSARLEQAVVGYFARWLPEHDVSIRYRRGWRRDGSLLELFRQSRDQAIRMGHLLQGPQRADLQLLSGGEEAQHRLSRGQQKVAVMALTLAKAQLIAEASGTEPILLVDDLPAELDEVRRKDVLGALEQVDAQVFVTCIEPQTIVGLDGTPTWFHVEHGRLATMV